MFPTTLARFGALRLPVRSLVFLYWVYIFTTSLVGIFTQIFLYQRFTNLTLNVIAALSFWTGIMFGFVICGYLASLFRINIKHGFASSFAVMGLSILLLYFSSGSLSAYVAMGLNGIGYGLFWLTIHTFELSETKDEERDFYSSLLSAGSQVFTLIGPALATALLWLSGPMLHLGTYTLLFILTPLIYLLGFFVFSNLQDYYPQRIVFADLVHFVSNGRNRLSQVYMLGVGSRYFLSGLIPPLAILLILGTAVRVGLYTTAASVFSTIFLLMLATFRSRTNRLFILGVSAIALAILSIQFGYQFTLIALIIYTIGDSIVSPALRVSEHVIDLQTMESMGRSGSDFYATMIFRDFSLWVWRFIAGGIFLAFVSFAATEKEALSLGLYMLAATFILTFLGAYILTAKK